MSGGVIYPTSVYRGTQIQGRMKCEMMPRSMRVASVCAGAALLREQNRGNFRCAKGIHALLVVWTGRKSRDQAASRGRRPGTPKKKTQRHLSMVVVLKMYAR